MEGSSTSGDRSSNIVGGFFYATLLLWLGSVWYYILFNNLVDLLFVIAGSLSSTKQLIGSYNSFSLETLFSLTPPSLFSIPQPLRLQVLLGTDSHTRNSMVRSPFRTFRKNLASSSNSKVVPQYESQNQQQVVEIKA